MLDEQLEFRLTQYLDGSLPPEEAPALFDELAKNRAALAALDEYRKLDLLMRARPAGIRWDALAEQISAHIDQDQQSRMRIGFMARPLRIAAAAVVLLAVGVATYVATRPGSPEGKTIAANPPAVREIAGPQVEVASGAAIVQIEIGPANLADGQAASYYYEEFASRPPRVIIASGAEPVFDERPY